MIIQLKVKNKGKKIMGMFVEEILDSWIKNRKISTTFDERRVENLIFQSLQNTVRFNGLVENGYTTMQHSYYVGCMARDMAIINSTNDSISLDEIMLCGMLHDIAECIVGDVIFPIKQKFFPKLYEPLEELENEFILWSGEHIFEINDFVSIWNKHKDLVKKADLFIGYMELIGISTDGDFCSTKYFSGFFSNSKDEIVSKYYDNLKRILFNLKNKVSYKMID